MSVDERMARIEALGYEYAQRDLETVRVCNLCGSDRQVAVSHRDRYGFPASFSICASCGLGFLTPRPTATEYARFYASTYRPLVSAYHGRLIDARTVQAEQREYAAELVEFLRPRVGAPPATVLDVGGSTGVIAGAIGAEFAAEATVLDPAPGELALAADAGFETIQGFAEEFDPGPRRWELVLMCQTIDHLLDIASTLDVLRGTLAPNGRAFVDVLDVEFMVRRRGSIEGAVKIDHPYYLTRATACAYFARAGLDVVSERMSADGHWGFLLAPGEPREVNHAALACSAERMLQRIWALRAEGPRA
jgi:SAM-dependent methyltransferase